MEAFNTDMDYVVGKCRWGTNEKNISISKYLKKQYGENYKEYIGIASDEYKRTERNHSEHKIYPLIDWKMTEEQCLQYCYNNGFFWNEGKIRLYDILDHVSCWCCTNKNKKELKNYKKFLPRYYKRLIRITFKVLKRAKNRKLIESTQNFLKKLLEIGKI